MNFPVSKGSSSNGQKPCDRTLYKEDGTIARPAMNPSMTPPGPPTEEPPGHLGHPITGHDGKAKKDVAWAKKDAEEMTKTGFCY
jgi:hypothetical protein